MIKYLIVLIAVMTIMGVTVSATQTYAQTENCDPSYPNVCIPPPPPDLNCGDITDKNVRVLPPDPHGLDRDVDGIGCER